MSRRTFRFDNAPLEREVVINGKHVAFKAVEAEIGPDGVRSTLDCYNGRVREDGSPAPLHSDRVLMSSDLARRRYYKAVVTADPTLDCPQLAQELMQIAVDLTARLASTAAPQPPEEASADPAALWAQCKELATAPDLLDRVVGAMASRGLVGETSSAKLVYLCATCRLLPEPLSVFVKGASSSGKSHLLKHVAATLPSDAYADFTAVSPRFLAYADLDLRHKIVMIYEAGGLDAGTGVYIMRSLLSEGVLKVGTVDRGDGDSLEAREITKEGPTALFTSTTAASLDGELETRALTITTTDTPAQSRAIMRGVAARQTGTAPTPIDLAPLHALQAWLACAGERRVLIPYAPALAEIVPAGAIRIRRDFGKLLTLISACAVLHQAQRPRHGDGTILAMLEDYAIVRGLVDESFGAAQQDGLTPKQREAVAAVVALQTENSQGVGLTAVAERLGLDKSSTKRRLDNPVRQGYLRNLEDRPRQPARYVPGEPLPKPVSALPEPGTLAEWESIEL